MLSRQTEGYPSAADYLGRPKSPSSPRWRDWYGDRDDYGAYEGAAAAAGGSEVRAHRQRHVRNHRSSAAAAVQPRQPVPHFDGAHVLAERRTYRGPAGALVPRGSGHPGMLFEAGLTQLRQTSSGSSSKQGAQSSGTADRVLQQLVNEGIDQTPIGGEHGKRRRRGCSASNSSHGSRGSRGSNATNSSAGSASEGSDGSRDRGNGRRSTAMQQQEVVEQQRRLEQQQEEQHRKDEFVMLERATLQAARRAASPERMRRCSSPDVVDAVVNAAAASAAATGVAQRAQQRQASGAGLRSYSACRYDRKLRFVYRCSMRKVQQAWQLCVQADGQQHAALCAGRALSKLRT